MGGSDPAEPRFHGIPGPFPDKRNVLGEVVMRASIVAIALAALLAVASSETQAEDLVHNSVYGFSVAAPDFPKQTDAGISITPLAFNGPLDAGKAPSCNVQIQNMGWTLSTFRTQSLGQFKALGLTVKSETPRKIGAKDALLLVSTGHDVTLESLAVQVGQSIYLLTCLSPTDQFDKYEHVFKRVVDSFVLTP